MSKVKTFEDLRIWQQAMSLSLDVYRFSKTMTDTYSKHQLNRAALSISNNIAEGFERDSRKTFLYFLKVAKGSCGEVRNMLHFLKSTEQMNEQVFNVFYETSMSVSKQINGLINYLKQYKTTDNTGTVQEDQAIYNL